MKRSQKLAKIYGADGNAPYKGDTEWLMVVIEFTKWIVPFLLVGIPLWRARGLKGVIRAT